MGNMISSTCELLCEDNGRHMTGEVLNFKENHYLTVSVNRQIKLELKWNGRVYHGHMANLSFVTPGPATVVATRTR